MARTSIADLKARFKRGMFPTEGDFANVFDSYVHKDDGIDIENVTTGNGSKTLTVLLQEIKEATVTEAVEAAKNEFPEIPELPEGLAEFIAKVNSFLEDADASDATINKWKEIEAFLSGITDTETLTGLLADLKSEIIGEVDGKLENKADKSTVEALDERVKALEEGSDEDEPKLDCLKVIADLDASTAPKGTIAIYSGDTNDKYTHGFIYEKKGEGGNKQTILSQAMRVEINGVEYYEDFNDRVSGIIFARSEDEQTFLFSVRTSVPYKNPAFVSDYFNRAYAKGESKGTLYVPTQEHSSAALEVGGVCPNTESYGGTVFYRGDGKIYYGCYGEDGIICLVEFDGSEIDLGSVIYGSVEKEEYVSDVTLGIAPSWTPLNVMNVIG